MEKFKLKCLSRGFVVFTTVIFLFAGSGYALNISITPDQASRTDSTGATNKLRVQIFGNNAIDLISMGILVTFDPAVLSIASASKNISFTDGFIMDGDGNPATEDDQYVTPAVDTSTPGSVTMKGGRLIGPGTTTDGLNGTVLLGWIDFNTVGNGSTSLNVALAEIHPNDPDDTFDNFVTLNGTVEDPAGLPADLSWVYVGDNACEGNLNGDNTVDILDFTAIGAEFGRIDCNNAGNICLSDFNGDGTVDILDLQTAGADFGRINCPTAPPL